MAEEAETVNKQQTRTRKSWSPVNSEAWVGWDWGRNDTNYCKNLEPEFISNDTGERRVWVGGVPRQFPVLHIQEEEAAVVSFCTQSSILSKHLRLDQRKTLPF